MTRQAISELTTETAEQMAEITARYPRLQAALCGASGGAWMREASLTLALAAQAHVALDEQALIYSDVRDLMALQARLRAVAPRR
jgi:acetyl-CoA carboxylase beta subunit